MDTCTELLECGICTEPYGDARFLHCGHTFCYHCLQKLHRPPLNAITCPNCRKQTSLARNGVAGLVVNFYVGKVKEVHSEMMKLKQEEVKKTTIITHLEGMTEMLRKDNADLQETISQADIMLRNNEKFAKKLKRNFNRKARKIQINLEESQEECNMLCADLQSWKALCWEHQKKSANLEEDHNLLGADLQQSEDLCDSLRNEIRKKSIDILSYSFNMRLSNAKFRDLEIEFNRAQTKCSHFEKKLGLIEEDHNLQSEALQHSVDMCEELRREIRRKSYSYSYNVKLSNAKYSDLIIKFNRAQACCRNIIIIIIIIISVFLLTGWNLLANLGGLEKLGSWLCK